MHVLETLINEITKEAPPHARSTASIGLLVMDAINFANEMHGAQKRKYTGERYTVHTEEVAVLFAKNSHRMFSYTEYCAGIIAALLHDTVEDTPATFRDVHVRFGELVAQTVGFLTDVSAPGDGNRATRKNIDRVHTAQGTSLSKTVKCFDLTSNAWDIAKHDKNFAKVYLAEMKLLLDGPLNGATSKAKQMAQKAYANSYRIVFAK